MSLTLPKEEIKKEELELKSLTRFSRPKSGEGGGVAGGGGGEGEVRLITSFSLGLFHNSFGMVRTPSKSVGPYQDD
jgi:hypothetical protein